MRWMSNMYSTDERFDHFCYWMTWYFLCLVVTFAKCLIVDSSPNHVYVTAAKNRVHFVQLCSSYYCYGGKYLVQIFSSLQRGKLKVDQGIQGMMWIEKAWLPCWPLYSQQVSHQRWIWGSHKRESTHPSWLWNPGQTSPEVQNRGISGPTKRTYVLQKLKKTNKKQSLVLLQTVCFIVEFASVYSAVQVEVSLCTGVNANRLRGRTGYFPHGLSHQT